AACCSTRSRRRRPSRCSSQPRRSRPSSSVCSSPLEHVIWIGGAPGAGKTTAARLLAHRNDLRLYHVDARTYRHADRATGPVMRAANAMSAEDRFRGSPSALAERFLSYSREQFELVLEDLDAFPASPPIVAEGPQIL